MTMMSLGMFAFSIDTLSFHELQRRRTWRYATNGRVGAVDAVQFVGKEADKVTLSGSAPTELMDGEESLATLIDMADDRQPYPLVDGTGAVHGAFVITAIDERKTHFHANGKPRMIDFGIDLIEVDWRPAA